MKLTVLSPVVHDGKEYAEGDTLDIKDEAAAASLIEAGAAEAVQGKRAAKAAAQAEPQPEAEAPAEQSSEG